MSRPPKALIGDDVVIVGSNHTMHRGKVVDRVYKYKTHELVYVIDCECGEVPSYIRGQHLEVEYENRV